MAKEKKPDGEQHHPKKLPKFLGMNLLSLFGVVIVVGIVITVVHRCVTGH